MFTALPNITLTARRLRSLRTATTDSSVSHHLYSDREAEGAVSLDRVLVGRASSTDFSPANGLTHLDAAGPELWTRSLISQTTQELQRLHPDLGLQLAAEDESRVSRESIEEALAYLKLYWADAAVESSLLIRGCIHVTGDRFLSSTSPRHLGVVIMNVAACRTVDGALEHLLHEAGHSALYLGEHFERYLYNPDELATHPLRTDTRPLSGVLHAAVATFRVSAGFMRLQPMWPEVPVMEQRYQVNSSNLGLILETLSKSAHWTPEGIRLFESLNTWMGRAENSH